MADDSERIALWAQGITGVEADEHMNARALSADERQERKARLEGRKGAQLFLPASPRAYKLWGHINP